MAVLPRSLGLAEGLERSVFIWRRVNEVELRRLKQRRPFVVRNLVYSLDKVFGFRELVAEAIVGSGELK